MPQGKRNNPQGKNQYTMAGAAKMAVKGLRNRVGGAVEQSMAPKSQTGTPEYYRPRMGYMEKVPAKMQDTPETAAMKKRTNARMAKGSQELRTAAVMAKSAIHADGMQVVHAIDKIGSFFGSGKKKR